MEKMWNNPTDIRCDLPQDRVAQLLEERTALMAKVRDIDEQMGAIMSMCEKWREMTGSVR